MDIPLINDFARRSFRDSAIRIIFRLELHIGTNSISSSGGALYQAIEKYLKAILLYNQESAKKLGHDVHKALTRVKSIAGLDFTVPNDVAEFVEFLADYGPDRYLSHPTHLREFALLTLDKSVWCIRRYCFYMRGEIETSDGTKDLLTINKQKATNPYYEKNRHKYRLMGGYLEKIIDKRKPIL